MLSIVSPAAGAGVPSEAEQPAGSTTARTRKKPAVMRADANKIAVFLMFSLRLLLTIALFYVEFSDKLSGVVGLIRLPVLLGPAEHSDIVQISLVKGVTVAR